MATELRDIYYSYVTDSVVNSVYELNDYCGDVLDYEYYYKDEHRHSHSFADILHFLAFDMEYEDAQLEDFKFDEFVEEYSSQQLELIKKFVNKYIEDKKSFS